MGSEERVYDERGNVRPLGTPGARPMTYEERVQIAAARNNTDASGEAEADEITSTSKRKK